MKKHTTMQSYLSLNLLLVPLILLSGCDWSSRSASCSVATEAAPKNLNDGSPALVTIGDRVVTTVKSLDEEFNAYLATNPNAQQMLMMVPDLKAQFLNGIVSQELVDENARRNKLNETPEYRAERDRIMIQVDRALNTRFFMDKLNVSVSDAEVRKFYDDNRDQIPELMVSPGGVKAEGVSFEQESEAKAFLAKAKEHAKESFEKVAADAGHKKGYHDFKLVNARSAGIDAPLKAKIIATTRVPGDELIQSGKTWWVVRVHSKEEPKYHPFEQIRPALADHLKKQKEAAALEEVINKLKVEYDVKIDDTPVRSAERAANKVAALDTEIMQLPEASALA